MRNGAFDINNHDPHIVDNIQHSIERHKCVSILGMPDPVWSQLERTTDFSFSIRHRFEFPALREEDLQKLMLTRHMISGYSLHYTKRTNLLSQILEELKLKQNHSSIWMKKLMTLSKGNRLEASRCWLNSIHKIDEAQATLHLCVQPKQTQINYNDEDLILFRHLIRFGWVTAQTLQQEFDCSEQAAQNWLEDLVNREVLRPAGHAFTLCEWLHFPITQELLHRGWLK